MPLRGEGCCVVGRASRDSARFGAMEEDTYRRTPIILLAELSTGILQARREWHYILKGKPTTLDSLPQQDYHSEEKERERISQTGKN